MKNFKNLFVFIISLFLVLNAHAQFKCGDDIVDTRDGKSYKTILIGNQCWIAENINLGTMIQSNKAGYQMTDNSVIEKYCWDNDEDYCDGTNGKPKLGGFYEWKEAVQNYSGQPDQPIQGVCPAGWHIPVRSEFEELASELGGNSVAGAKMKEGGSSGFEGALCGYRCTMTGGFRINAMGTSKSTYYWAAEQSDNDNAYFYEINDLDDKFIPCQFSPFTKSLGNTIRCIKDETSSTENSDYKNFNIDKVSVSNNQLNVFYYTYYDAVEFKIALYDSNGRLVHSKAMRVAEGSNFYQIDISQYSKGLYIIKVQANNEIASKSILIP